MRNKLHFVHKGWLVKRLEKLPDMSPTHEVSRILKISVSTLTRWHQDQYFLQAQVAVKGSGTWLWDKAKLKAWLLCLYGPPDSNAMAENPGEDTPDIFSRETARQFLGMPLNYSVRMGRDNKKGEIQGEGSE